MSTNDEYWVPLQVEIKDIENRIHELASYVAEFSKRVDETEGESSRAAYLVSDVLSCLDAAVEACMPKHDTHAPLLP